MSNHYIAPGERLPTKAKRKENKPKRKSLTLIPEFFATQGHETPLFDRAVYTRRSKASAGILLVSWAS